MLRKAMKIKARILLFALVCVEVLFVIGCSGETDPNAKIDAPGYYNGPMKGKGANSTAGGGAAQPE